MIRKVVKYVGRSDWVCIWENREGNQWVKRCGCAGMIKQGSGDSNALWVCDGDYRVGMQGVRYRACM